MKPDPKPYQIAGIDFLAPQDAALLGDDTGLGKSLQLIRAADRRGSRRILICCPAIGRVSWRRQLAEWQTLDPSRPDFYYPDETAGVIPTGPLALIVTYEWLSDKRRAKSFLKALANAEPFDVLFADEAHYLKSPSAARTKAVYGARLDRKNSVSEGIPALWPASATFTPNHVGELYTHLRAVLPDVLRDCFRGELPTFAEFRDRYCRTVATPFGVQITGNNRDTVPELAAAIRKRFLVRHKRDVLKELDPITFVDLPFEVPGPPDTVDTALHNTLDAAEACGCDDDVLVRSLRALAHNSDQVSTRRRSLGLLKVKAAAQWIADFCGNRPRAKLVVFAHHTDVIETLLADTTLAAYKPVAIYGQTNNAEKGAIVDAFQNDPNVRLFIGQTIAAGTSITLTAASDVLLLEPDWTPDNNYQAISRCHRIGQQESVTAYFATAAGTIDERIGRVLRRKAQDNAQLRDALRADPTPD